MAPTNFISVCVCVCPAIKAYILVTMGRILINLDENVGTYVQWIVLEFDISAAKGNLTTIILLWRLIARKIINRF